MKERWINEMRRKLEGHRKAPPPGLWEDISKQMGLAPEPARRAPVFGRWHWMAAAAVLALAGFFVFYPHNTDKDIKMAENTAIPYTETVENAPDTQPEAVSKQMPAMPQHAAQQPTETEDAAQQPTTSNRQVQELTQPAAVRTDASNNTDDSSKENVLSKADVSTHNTEPSQKSETAPQDEQMASQESSKPSTDTKTSYPTSHRTPSAKAKAGQWSVGLKASGGLLAAERSKLSHSAMANHYYSYANSLIYEAYEDKNAPLTGKNTFAASLAEYKWKHQLPIRLGLSLQHQLTPRLSLLSGLNYTYLYSEYSIPAYQSEVNSQKLHYIGIPINVAYQLLSSHNFQLYLSAGGAVEKCLNEKPWQCSVQAAAGAEYVVSPVVGLYVEPSLGYFFDDGTTFEHYYKEHPLAPAIEFGLRMHISR